MKLYATTISERASKSQGGNEYLRVKITVGESKNPYKLGEVLLRNSGTGWLLEWLGRGYGHIGPQLLHGGTGKWSEISPETKENKQENDTLCEKCGYFITRCKCVDNL